MALTTSPFSMNNVSITLKTTAGGTATEYRCQLNRAELVPSAGASAGGGTPMETFCETFETTGIANASWTLELAGFTALKDATDLTLFLFDHEGEELDYKLTPMGGTVGPTNPAFTGQVTAAPTNIGGTANQYAQFSVSLAALGKPTKVIA